MSYHLPYLGVNLCDFAQYCNLTCMLGHLCSSGACVGMADTTLEDCCRRNAVSHQTLWSAWKGVDLPFAKGHCTTALRCRSRVSLKLKRLQTQLPKQPMRKS
eukprot:5174492-Amphidinium_carterae.1